GDGFAMARHLDLRGIRVKVLLWGNVDELRGDAAANFSILTRSGIHLGLFGQRYSEAELNTQLIGCEWIVDALLGTGAVGEPRPPLDDVIAHLNRHEARKLAVDLPSGLDCDSGL